MASNLDQDLNNADWTKRKLDVLIADGSRLVLTVEELAEAANMTVEQVKLLPVYVLNKKRLKG